MNTPRPAIGADRLEALIDKLRIAIQVVVAILAAALSCVTGKAIMKSGIAP